MGILVVRCVHLLRALGMGVLGLVVYNEGGTCPYIFHTVGVAFRLLSLYVGEGSV